MAAKAFSDWVEGDVAIEIISKMIAEQTGEMYRLLSSFDDAGFSVSEPEVQNNEQYLRYRAAIDAYQQEIKISTTVAMRKLKLLFKKLNDTMLPTCFKNKVA